MLLRWSNKHNTGYIFRQCVPGLWGLSTRRR